jgi:hypothetical protein
LAREKSTSEDDIAGQRVEWYSAEEATVDRSAVGSLDARYADVDRSLVSQVRAEDANVSQSAVGMASIAAR